jgi:hypothetical protein
MKDDVKVKVPNGTPNIRIPTDSGRPEGNYATHF